MAVQLGNINRPVSLKIVAVLEILWGLLVVPNWISIISDNMNEGIAFVSVLAYLFEIVIGILFFFSGFGLWTLNYKLYRVAKILAIFEIIRGILAFLAGLLPVLMIFHGGIYMYLRKQEVQELFIYGNHPQIAQIDSEKPIVDIKPVTSKRVRDSKQRQIRSQTVIQREEELAITKRLGELSELAKIEILHFQDLAERYAVSSSLIQNTIENFVSEGVLWGITTNKTFIGVEFATTTLKKLSNEFRRITWQSLMEEFKLESEKDLKVLLIQVSHSQKVAFTIDEIEKSVQILSDEARKPTKHTPSDIVCPSCGTSLDSKTNQCENCGDAFQRCIVCHLPVLDDFTMTPCCGSPAHSIHLREWLKIKETCPNCKDKLKEEWII